MRKINAGTPLFTNAQHNRDMAMKCSKAGMTINQIAEEWPEVWKTSQSLDGRTLLGQKYDYELNDGSGRFETNRMITSESVKKAIAKYRRKIIK